MMRFLRRLADEFWFLPFIRGTDGLTGWQRRMDIKADLTAAVHGHTAWRQVVHNFYHNPEPESGEDCE